MYYALPTPLMTHRLPRNGNNDSAIGDAARPMLAANCKGSINENQIS